MKRILILATVFGFMLASSGCERNLETAYSL